MSVQKKHGGELSDEEFRKFTLYCNQSNNYHDDTKRAEILGQTNEDVRIAPGAIVRIRGNQIGKKSYVGLYSYVNGDIELGENVLIGPTANIVGSNHVYNREDDFFSNRSDDVAGKVVIEDGTHDFQVHLSPSQAYPAAVNPPSFNWPQKDALQHYRLELKNLSS